MEKLPENKKNGGDNFDTIQKEVDSLEKELELILDSNINYTQLNRINEIIKRLNEINPKSNSFSKENAWKDFEKNYLPKIDNSNKKLKAPKRKLSIAVGIILAFVCINLFSAIAGINIFKPLLEWTSDVLNLKSENTYSVNEDGFINFESITDLEKYMNEYIPIPEYLPENSKLASIELSSLNQITILYTNNKYNIKYQIYPIGSNFDISIEKTKENYSEYNFNNIEFYCFKNNGWSIIEWSLNNKIYCITGKFSENESIEIIKNINIKETIQ